MRREILYALDEKIPFTTDINVAYEVIDVMSTVIVANTQCLLKLDNFLYVHVIFC